MMALSKNISLFLHDVVLTVFTCFLITRRFTIARPELLRYFIIKAVFHSVQKSGLTKNSGMIFVSACAV